MTMHQESQQKRSHADWWLFVGGFIVFLALGFWVTPAILYAEKPQPFQFSHDLHLKQVADGCKTCHTFRKDGSYTGIPDTQVCLDCHSEEPLGKTPEEKVFVTQYLIPKKPVPWKVYSKQPDCVFFSHAAHVLNAEQECTTCHGAHGTSKKLRIYEENRLSGYSRDIWGWSMVPLGGPPDRMKMDDCAQCHRENGVRDACFVCHK